LIEGPEIGVSMNAAPTLRLERFRIVGGRIGASIDQAMLSLRDGAITGNATGLVTGERSSESFWKLLDRVDYDNDIDLLRLEP
jgi:hypothetical protein